MKFGMLVTAIALLCAPVLAQRSDPRLTVADVERVSGVKGIQLVSAGSVPGAGPGVNFAGPDKRMVLMVNFGTEALYRRAKEQKAVGGMSMPLFHADVPGVGDEAFDSPPGPLQYVLYVRKAANAASFTAYFVSRTKKTTLTMDQLKQLAAIALGRM
jgi:hypothetical protein